MIKRRSVLIATVSLPFGVVAETFASEFSLKHLAQKHIENEGVHITLPKIAESGNSVPITVSVDSPMSEASYVKAVHIFVPGNPDTKAATYYFTPSSGKAQIATRVKLARTQVVRAIAEMSDGSLKGQGVSILVTAGACIEELWFD